MRLTCSGLFPVGMLGGSGICSTASEDFSRSSSWSEVSEQKRKLFYKSWKLKSMLHFCTTSNTYSAPDVCGWDPLEESEEKTYFITHFITYFITNSLHWKLSWCHGSHWWPLLPSPPFPSEGLENQSSSKGRDAGKPTSALEFGIPVWPPGPTASIWYFVLPLAEAMSGIWSTKLLLTVHTCFSKFSCPIWKHFIRSISFNN